MIWPLIEKPDKQFSQNKTFLTESYLGDGTQAILPIPIQLNLDEQKIRLGEKLFADPRLSGNGFSCATCHSLTNAGMDGLETSIIISGGFDTKNTPTVFNSGFNAMQLWNGEAETLENQLNMVIQNPEHMGSSWPVITSKLQADDSYVKSFNLSYSDGINQKNITNALISYERSMTTPNSDFDRYLRGNESAISARQLKGFQLFQDYGCISCHQGVNVGGNLFARFGIFENHLSKKGALTDYDYGRFNYTRQPKDKFVFRVPSLRNVSRTAPYFHDGSVATLPEAIKIMAKVQLDIDLPDEDISLIESFLISLRGFYKGKML
ncbi:MAG: c-type cytochrome [Gammaproteobacteria bacterium]|nr:c-type cytochrome [Gammaproteobacteria bacterium]